MEDRSRSQSRSDNDSPGPINLCIAGPSRAPTMIPERYNSLSNPSSTFRTIASTATEAETRRALFQPFLTQAEREQQQRSHTSHEHNTYQHSQQLQQQAAYNFAYPFRNNIPSSIPTHPPQIQQHDSIYTSAATALHQYSTQTPTAYRQQYPNSTWRIQTTGIYNPIGYMQQQVNTFPSTTNTHEHTQSRSSAPTQERNTKQAQKRKASTLPLTQGKATMNPAQLDYHAYLKAQEQAGMTVIPFFKNPVKKLMHMDRKEPTMPTCYLMVRSVLSDLEVHLHHKRTHSLEVRIRLRLTAGLHFACW
jgi:hypothetical protein